MMKLKLPSMFEESLSDLDRLLHILNVPSMSQDSFVSLMNGLGCDKKNEAGTSDKPEKLFQRLLTMCKEAEFYTEEYNRDNSIAFQPNSNALNKGELNIEAFRRLYSFHPSYATCRNPMDSSQAIANWFKEHYNSSKQHRESSMLNRLSVHGKKPILEDVISESSSVLLGKCVDEEKKQEEEQTCDDCTESITDETTKGSEESSVNELLLSFHGMTVSHHSRRLDNMNASQHSIASSLDISNHHHRNMRPQFDLQLLKKNSFHGRNGGKSFVDDEYDDKLLESSINPCSFVAINNKINTTHRKRTDTKKIFHGKLKEKIFDPFHSTSDEFVDAVEKETLKHDCLKHHVLTSLSMGSWGSLNDTIGYLVNFLKAYRYFTSKFSILLTQTMNLVGQVDTEDGEFIEILDENKNEENGIYDDDAMQMIQNLGLDAKKLYGVAHKDLYKKCVEDLRQYADRTSKEEFSEEMCLYISEPLVSAFESACDPSKGATAATSIAAMYFGSELIVSTLYSKLSAFLLASIEKNKVDCCLSKEDVAFFLLHMDMDVEHAEKMRIIVSSIADDEDSRVEMALAVDQILDARVEFYNRFMEASFPHEPCDKQIENWAPKAETCLSDFTGSPIVFDICKPHIPESYVLDVGCGEGFYARKFVEMGAKKIVGFDDSCEMIECAKVNPDFNPDREVYQVCNAENILEKFQEMPATLGVLPGRLVEEGCFDLATAIFLFDQANITQMKNICTKIFQLLKPGGHFVFSVHHPSMLQAHAQESGLENESAFSFKACDNDKTGSYFSLRDQKFAGVIKTPDGRDLNMKMLFKSISDYTETMESVGFSIEKMHEARVKQDYVASDPEFFNSVKDLPLHLVFDVMKPLKYVEIGRIPKAIHWSCFEKSNAVNILTLSMPESVSKELLEVTTEAYELGFTEETFIASRNFTDRLTQTASFAKTIRNRLVSQTGAVHLTNFLDIDTMKKDTTDSKEEICDKAKLAYYILSSLIGKVDGSARGRLFDVVDKGLNTKDDNVLFSVSRDAAPWHTDGASAEKAYDGVGLLCISPPKKGGALHLNNVALTWASLQKKIPKFILSELCRPVPREILENGDGDGVSESLKFTRQADLLKLRVCHNAFPIFETGVSPSSEGDHLLRFRYMRQWIESGHEKADLELSPLLQLAMDALDKTMDEEKVLSVQLKAGDVLYCNNMNFSHSRDEFVNDKNNCRHHVRVWLKLQEYV